MERAGYILVVDDDSTIGELIAEVLTDAGHTVFAVLNGTCALSVVAAHLPAGPRPAAWSPGPAPPCRR